MPGAWRGPCVAQSSRRSELLQVVECRTVNQPGHEPPRETYDYSRVAVLGRVRLGGARPVAVNGGLNQPAPNDAEAERWLTTMRLAAKKAGVKFSCGTNNTGAQDLGRNEYCGRDDQCV